MPLLTWTEYDLSLSRLTLHVREVGGDGPALLLLHGLSVDGSIWHAVARRLMSSFTIIAPDLRGHGRSDHPATGYVAGDYAADIAELLDALAPRFGPLNLLGHSLGALAALGAAADQPGLVRRLILEDPPLDGPGQLGPYLRAVLEAKRSGEAALQAVVRRFQPELGELVARVLAGMWERVSDGAITAILDQPGTVFASNDWLRRVQALTLLMQADPALDARLSPAAAARALAQLRQGQLVQVSGAGHVIHAVSIAEFCRLVREFLLGAEASAGG